MKRGEEGSECVLVFSTHSILQVFIENQPLDSVGPEKYRKGLTPVFVSRSAILQIHTSSFIHSIKYLQTFLVIFAGINDERNNWLIEQKLVGSIRNMIENINFEVKSQSDASFSRTAIEYTRMIKIHVTHFEAFYSMD